jgi:hypothetical protein
MVPDHSSHVKTLDRNALVLAHQPCRELMLVIVTLVSNLLMQSGDFQYCSS